jgi:hypothetical protein
MKFDTLLTFVRRGRVKPRSIVRGPTTHQLWRFASQVKGLSREFGVCYSCGQAIAQTATVCLHCNRLQDAPVNPDVFLEGQETEPRPSPAANPRDTGPVPLMAEDIVVPTFAAGQADPASAHQAFGDAAAGKDRNKKGADGFLTAEDLATAFQLDFQPKERKPRKTPVSPVAMNSGRNSAPSATAKPRRRWKRVAALILLILIAGATAFEYRHDPNVHAQMDHGMNVTVDWAKQKWAALQTPATKPAHTDAAPQVLQVQVAPPETISPAPVATQPAPKTNPWDQLYHQQSTDTAAIPDKSAPADDTSVKVVPPPPAPKHREGTREDVWKIYGSALDAEGQHDYAGAIKKYEEIKEYPSSLWPSDLELRLKAARLQMH